MSDSVDWTFDGTWPFAPRWHECGAGRMHYVDEGSRDGRPVVLLHGNPTWGYLYRRIVPPLVSAGNRVIVPDHLGFGRSDKPREPTLYEVSRHARRLEILLESLDLNGAVLAAHDWGGPIGLRWATRHPERVDGLFLVNTMAHEFRGSRFSGGRVRVPLPAPLRILRAPVIGELLVQGLDAFKPLMFRLAIERGEPLPPAAQRAYRAVHAGWSERAAMLMFARQVPVGEGGSVNRMNAEIEAGLRRHFNAKPAHIVWGMKDRVLLPSYIEWWEDTLSRAEVTRIQDAGHFVQEDAPEWLISDLTRFVNAL